MAPTVIHVTPEGKIETLHNDHLELNRLGKMRVVRATDIEFNEDSQQWEVRRVVRETCRPAGPTNKDKSYLKRTRLLGPVEFSNESRDACLAWERENVKI